MGGAAALVAAPGQVKEAAMPAADTTVAGVALTSVDKVLFPGRA